jgi:aminoglycoside phosphotransferase (APT) family kinase protein
MAFRARQVDGVEVVIKLTKGRNSYPVEQWAYAEYARVGVPSPQVLYYCESLPSMGYSCLVMTMIDGVPSFTAEEQYAGLFGEAGDLLGKIHAVAVPNQRFGLGAFLLSTPTKQFTSWLQFVTAQHEHPSSGQYLRCHGLWPDCAGDLGLLGGKIAAHSFLCVVNHGDFGPDHLLVRAGRIAGVIDPGEAFVGPPEYDLAHIAIYISGYQLGQLLSQYPGDLDLEMVHVYSATIALHKAARAHQAGNVARARVFAQIAQNAYRCFEQLKASAFSAELPMSSSSGCYVELEKTI